MICVFFGHGNATGSIRMSLKATIYGLIKSGVHDFYVGNNGNFDYIVQSVLCEIINEDYDINFTVVLSRPDEIAIFAKQIYTMLPDGLENVPPRFAISKRNEWMLKKLK